MAGLFLVGFAVFGLGWILGRLRGFLEGLRVWLPFSRVLFRFGGS